MIWLVCTVQYRVKKCTEQRILCHAASQKVQSCRASTRTKGRHPNIARNRLTHLSPSLYLQVKCPYHVHGCQVQLTVRSVEEHKLVCTYTPEACPNFCGRMISLPQLTEHLLTSCQKRLTHCHHCGYVGTWSLSLFSVYWLVDCPCIYCKNLERI